MTDFSKMSAERLAGQIVARIEGYVEDHTVYAGRYNADIRTQIGHDQENDGNPAIDIHVKNDSLNILDGLNTKTLKFEDYDLTRRAGFDILMEDVNKELCKYYSQWKEQPRYIKK